VGLGEGLRRARLARGPDHGGLDLPGEAPVEVDDEAIAEDVLDAERVRDRPDLEARRRGGEHDAMTADLVGGHELDDRDMQTRTDLALEQGVAEEREVRRRATGEGTQRELEELLESDPAEQSVEAQAQGLGDDARIELALAETMLEEGGGGEARDERAVEVEEGGHVGAGLAVFDLGQRMGVGQLGHSAPGSTASSSISSNASRRQRSRSPASRTAAGS